MSYSANKIYYSETLNKEYIERIHQMSYSSISDNGMLQIFSFLIKWLLEIDLLIFRFYLYAWACAHNPYPKKKLLLKLKIKWLYGTL